MNIIILALAGGGGAIARYLLGRKITSRYPVPSFPLAMLIVNIIGAFGLGAFYGFYFQSIPLNAYDNLWYLALGIGFFGAFTTFSTFSIEAVELLRKKEFRQMSWYIGLSIIGSVLTFIIGFSLGVLTIN